MEGLNHKDWKGVTGGTPWMQRMLVAWFRFSPLIIPYFCMAWVVPFYMIFNHNGYLAIYRYFRNRHGYGRLKAFIYVYINHFRFGQIIIDRFAMYAGKHFEMEIEGQDMFDELDNSDDGFIQLSSHVGNYELAGYSLKPQKKSFNVLVFAGETKQVMNGRHSMFAGKRIQMIPISEDMSHIFLINNALSEGNIVSIPGDRVFGSPRSVKCNFMGGEASFPLGPFAMATQRGINMLAVFVMKKSIHKYCIYVKRISVPADVDRKMKAHALTQVYADELEMMMRKYPAQWFNYFDFWKQ